MDKTLKIALILTAVDKMTSVISGATNAATRKIQEMQEKSSKYLMQGMALTTAGAGGFAMLGKAKDAFAKLQDASNDLKISMLRDGGILDQSTFDKLDKFTNTLSSKFTGSAADYKDMVSVMKRNGLQPADILGGTGEAVAQLAVLFDMLPSNIGLFASRMKMDMGVSNNEMTKMTDLVARLYGSGVGERPDEAVHEMTEFYSQVGIGLKALNVTGVESAKTVGALGGMFIKTGMSGAKVGSNFRRIFDGVRDGTKLAKANEQAAKFGITLDMFDKKGNFRSIDNFVGQIGKLRGLNPANIAAILKPFGGRQGLSTDFLELLAGKHGVPVFNEFIKSLSDQATQADKLKQKMSSLNKQQEVMSTNYTNMIAAMGKPLFENELTKIYTLLGKVADKITLFARAHPDLAKFITISVALVSAISSIAGAIYLVKFAMTALKITSLANPVVLTIAAIAIGAALIYTYWKPIKAFFINLWSGIKNIFASVWAWVKGSILVYFIPALLIFKYWDKLKPFFSALWEFVKTIFKAGLYIIKFLLLNFTPVGLVFKYWDKLKPYFIAILKSVYQPFLDIFNFVWNLNKMFYNAGKNIIDSIVDGIMSKVDKVTSVIKKVTQKIRDFFPFSPAKTGPLTDLHRVKIMETVAQNISARPVTNAMNRASMQLQPIGSGSSGRSMNVTFNFNGVSGDIITQIRSKKREVIRELEDINRQMNRTKF